MLRKNREKKLIETVNDSKYTGVVILLANISDSLKGTEMRSGILTLRSPLRNILERYGVEYTTFKGAVIDLETDERNFLDECHGADRYKNHCAVCCGILDKNTVEIIAKTCNASDELFVQAVDEKLRRTNHPYYAFNVGCDMALLTKLLGREIRFDRELQNEYESKRYVVQNLRIPNFDDPFNGWGYLAAKEWTKHLETRETDCVKRIIAHNLACVLKEYNILMRRGYRGIEPSSYEAFFEGKNDLVFVRAIPKPK